MRFCIVSTQNDWGGGEILIASVARHLELAGHSVAWIVRSGSEVARRIELNRAHILHWTRGRGRSLRDWLAVRAGIVQWSPDVLIMNDTHAVPLAGASAWLNRRTKPLRLAYKHTIFPVRSKLKYRLLTDRVICVSKAAQATVVLGGIAPERCVMIYGGTEPPATDVNARQEIRTELGLGPSDFLLVAVGNLLACKGHHDLIIALERLAETFPQAYTVIAGEGQERKNLERTIAQVSLGNRIKLLGFRPDANRLLQAADLVVHPSHAEGLSLVLIQAQMLGKPIVATAVGGTCEVLNAVGPVNSSANHSSAWIAKPHDPQDLSKQLLEACTTLAQSPMEDALQRQLETALQRANQLFNIQRNTQQLADYAACLLNS